MAKAIRSGVFSAFPIGDGVHWTVTSLGSAYCYVKPREWAALARLVSRMQQAANRKPRKGRKG